MTRPTKIDLLKLERLYEEGLTPLEIAPELGVCTATVYKWLHRLDLFYRIKALEINVERALRLLERGTTLTATARQLGCTEEALRRAVRRAGWPPQQTNVSDEEKARIIELAHMQLTRKEIRRQTGRGAGTVNLILRKAGISTSGNKRRRWMQNWTIVPPENIVPTLLQLNPIEQN